MHYFNAVIVQYTTIDSSLLCYKWRIETKLGQNLKQRDDAKWKVESEKAKCGPKWRVVCEQVRYIYVKSMWMPDNHSQINMLNIRFQYHGH